MAKTTKTKPSKEAKAKTIVKEKTKSNKETAIEPIAQDKPKSKVKGKGKAKAAAPEPVPAPIQEEKAEEEVEEEDEDQESDGSSDEDDDGVDDEGMQRLLEALGDNGLDDYDRAQILSLNGLDEEESGEEASGDEGLDGAIESDSEGDEELVEEADENSEGEDDEEEAGDEILLDEADDSVDEDAVPTRKVEIDNEVAMERIRNTIALDPSLPWTETLTITYPHTIDVAVDDDLNREVAFYKQALYCANEARSLAAKHKFPFSRPSDYFAEMVKSDSHMERIRHRLLNETAAIKTAEDKRKQREGKKYGKQVQTEKLKEREKSKKDMEEKLKGLKRKRKDMLTTDGEGGETNGEEFDVAVENAISDKANKRPKISRDSRDKKFGFGPGKTAGRRSKQNTRESTDNFVGGGGGKDKGKRQSAGGKKTTQRLGKSKRMNSRRK